MSESTHSTTKLAEAYANLSSLTLPIEQAIARKAILQTNILSYPAGQFDFGNQQPIELGIFRVFPTTAEIDWSTPSGEFEIHAGEAYLDFHMPKSDNLSNATANASYTQIAEYMKSHPRIGSIMAVTYRVMALSAKHNQGFNTEKVILPDAVMDYASTYWQAMMPDVKPKQFETAHIVWQTRQGFIDRFGSVDSQ